MIFCSKKLSIHHEDHEEHEEKHKRNSKIISIFLQLLRELRVFRGKKTFRAGSSNIERELTTWLIHPV